MRFRGEWGQNRRRLVHLPELIDRPWSTGLSRASAPRRRDTDFGYLFCFLADLGFPDFILQYLNDLFILI